MNAYSEIDNESENLTENYSSAKELFEGSIHILCSNGSFQSRLKRAYMAVSEIEPETELPKSLVPRFDELKHRLHDLKRECELDSLDEDDIDVLAKTIDSLNAMDRSIIIDSFISLYRNLLEIDNRISI